MKPIRLGVIGVGAMGTYHAQQLAAGKVPRAELTAVCDRDPVQLAKFPGVRTFAQHTDLLQAGVVDAVLIATPHYDHTTIGIAALQQGLHVLVEKPISVHKADCERLIAAAHPGQVFAAMLNQRTDPYYERIRQLVQAGELGALQRLQWTITDWFRSDLYYASSPWRATWAGEGGGVLLNQATHNLDLWQWMFGLPVRVRARCGFGRHHAIEVEDDVTAVMEYANGATGVFITSTGEAPGLNRLEVVGDRGRVVYENNVLLVTRNAVASGEFSRQSDKFYDLPAQQTQRVEFPDHGGQHLAVVRNFVAAILDGEPLIAPAAEGTGAVELANAMIWSALRDAPVTLPLDSAGYQQQLQQLVQHSRAKQSLAHKTHDEVAPYLVKENAL